MNPADQQYYHPQNAMPEVNDLYTMVMDFMKMRNWII